MKRFAVFIAVLLIAVSTKAQQTNYKFDFGTKRTQKGYTAITADSKFDEKKGYGFTNGSTVTVVERNSNPLTGDYITSVNPFYFSVKLPDGNYDVVLFFCKTTRWKL